jgi:hypothetical protein
VGTASIDSHELGCDAPAAKTFRGVTSAATFSSNHSVAREFGVYVPKSHGFGTKFFLAAAQKFVNSPCKARKNVLYYIIYVPFTLLL